MKWSFKFFLKVGKEDDRLTEAGKVFQIFGPVNMIDCWHLVRRQKRGIARSRFRVARS